MVGHLVCTMSFMCKLLGKWKKSVFVLNCSVSCLIEMFIMAGLAFCPAGLLCPSTPPWSATLSSSAPFSVGTCWALLENNC